MSETVFILGAGASADAGAPVMARFLDKAEHLWKRPQNGRTYDFSLVFKSLEQLQSVHGNAKLDVNNVESVFAAFEAAAFLGKLGNLSRDELMQLPQAMRRMISETIEESVRFPVSTDGPEAPGFYRRFADLLEVLGGSDNSHSCSVITFNYDLCADIALGDNVDYALGSAPTDGRRLLKLHGSLNWTFCPTCSRISTYSLSRLFQRTAWRPHITGAKSTSLLATAKLPDQCEHCNADGVERPAIVPPTWDKSLYYPQLKPIWQAAAAELEEAQNIIITGYSLPQSDHFFRHLYALGTIGASRLKRFYVFDPNASVEDSYRGLLGPVAAERFKFYPETFQKAVTILSSMVDKAGGWLH